MPKMEKEEEMKEEMRELLRNYSLTMETTIRQRDEEIATLKNKDQKEKTETGEEVGKDPTPDAWLGQSPGPDVMQGRTSATVKQTPMAAQIETPNKDWDELLDEAIADWISIISRTGKQAPEEYVVQGRLVHNFRQLVEQRINNTTNPNDRFKIIKQSPKAYGISDATEKDYYTNL